MNMLRKLTMIAAVGLITWGGCSRGTEPNPSPGASEGSEATPPEQSRQNGAMSAITDGQILQVLANVDSGEIEQAHVALSKAQSLAVREFAQHMVDQHTNAQRESQQLSVQTKIIPSPSAPADKVHAKGVEALEQLKGADAASFDATYIQAQVKQHEDVLKMLNETLIPSASSAELRTALAKTKSMVQHHIDMAKKIQM